MTSAEKVAHLLALARSTSFAQDTVTQQRFPGPLPAYCSEDCKREAQRAQPRERQR